MFVVTEADAAAIRTTFEQHGELSAVIELRRMFPASETTSRWECVRIITGWKALPTRKIRSRQLRAENVG
jgi:hypothetical protein